MSPPTVTDQFGVQFEPVQGADGVNGAGRMKKLSVPVSALPFESVAVSRDRSTGVPVIAAFGAENESFTIALPLTFAMLIDENVEELRARIFDGFALSRTSTKTESTVSPPSGFD